MVTERTYSPITWYQVGTLSHYKQEYQRLECIQCLLDLIFFAFEDLHFLEKFYLVCFEIFFNCTYVNKSFLLIIHKRAYTLMFYHAEFTSLSKRLSSCNLIWLYAELFPWSDFIIYIYKWLQACLGHSIFFSLTFQLWKLNQRPCWKDT